MEVAKYRASQNPEPGGASEIVPWKPDPMIVDMWKRWAQEQEDLKADNERAMKTEGGRGVANGGNGGGLSSAMDPTRAADDNVIKQSCQCICS